jgi:hypothetical protein
MFPALWHPCAVAAVAQEIAMSTNTLGTSPGPSEKRLLQAQLDMLMRVAASRLMNGAAVAAIRDNFVGVGMPTASANSMVAQLVAGLAEEHSTAMRGRLFGISFGLIVALVGLLFLLAFGRDARVLVLVLGGLAVAVWGVVATFGRGRTRGQAIARLRAELDELHRPRELRRAA